MGTRYGRKLDEGRENQTIAANGNSGGTRGCFVECWCRCCGGVGGRRPRIQTWTSSNLFSPGSPNLFPLHDGKKGAFLNKKRSEVSRWDENWGDSGDVH